MTPTDPPAAPTAPAGALARAERIRQAAERAEAALEASLSSETRRAYRTAWRQFCGWCDLTGLVSLPADPATVALYIADLSGDKGDKTIQKSLSAIGHYHRAGGHPNPAGDHRVRSVMRGVRRLIGRPSRPKRAVRLGTLRRMVDTCGDDAAGIRDRAVLLVGWAAALRRSELAGMQLADLQGTEGGYIYTIPRSKTDQAGQGQEVGIPRVDAGRMCPAGALEAWIDRAGVTDGPIFRSVTRWGVIGDTALTPRSVALIVKRAAESAGLDPSFYAGHSLRSGLATSAGAEGIEERRIQRITRHRSLSVLRGYIHRGDATGPDNVAARLLRRGAGEE